MSGVGLEIDARGLCMDRRDQLSALVDVSFHVDPGEVVGVTGPSGCGKTTLLSLLGGLERPTSGSVHLDGFDRALASRAEGTRLARQIGMVFQSAAMIRRMPVWENVTAGLVPLGIAANVRHERAVAALSRLGVERHALRRPERLSAGERQRVAVARAGMLSPRLLLADEPTSHLDPEAAERVWTELERIRANGATVLIASHDEALIARTSRRLHLTNGRLTA